MLEDMGVGGVLRTPIFYYLVYVQPLVQYSKINHSSSYNFFKVRTYNNFYGPYYTLCRAYRVGCGFICQNGNFIMAIAFFTVYRVYNWEFNSRKEIKVILPTWDGTFLNPLIYYMNIAKKIHWNPCFWENCLFG